jgi:hypothetical protein
VGASTILVDGQEVGHGGAEARILPGALRVVVGKP